MPLVCVKGVSTVFTWFAMPFVELKRAATAVGLDRERLVQRAGVERERAVGRLGDADIGQGLDLGEPVSGTAALTVERRVPIRFSYIGSSESALEAPVLALTAVSLFRYESTVL